MARVEGKNIVLREFRAEDISGMRSWITDGSITRFLGGAFVVPQTWEQTESYLQSLLNGNAGGVNFAVAEKGSLRYLGQCNLLMIDNMARKAELAVVLAPDSIGKGYGSEAVALLLRYAFYEYNLHRVYLHAWADNARALRVYEKAGFRTEGVLCQDAYREGAYRDRVVMGILREEYEAACMKENS